VVAGGRRNVGGSWLQVVPWPARASLSDLPIHRRLRIHRRVRRRFRVRRHPRQRGGEVGYLIEELGEVFNAVTFIVFGAVLLGPVLGDVTWSIVLYAVLSLTVVRLIPVAIAMIGTGARRQTSPFSAGSGRVGLRRSSSRCSCSRRADCHTMV
jgi:hypothetical protein